VADPPSEETRTLRRIVSGGQTGVDRAALDAGLAVGLPIGGWCPSGRAAEDGPIPPHYTLEETPSSDPAERTEWNVRDSDGTLVLLVGEASGGTALTIRLAHEMLRPLRISRLDAGEADAPEIAGWIRDERIATLNVAGPRERESPGIGARSRTFLLETLRLAMEGDA